MKKLTKLVLVLIILMGLFFTTGCPNPSTDTDPDTDPELTIPIAPTNLIATVESYTVISLTWLDNSNNETGFIVEWSQDNFTTIEDFSKPGINATMFVLTGLNSNKEYFFRVKAINSLGDSDSIKTSATTAMIMVGTFDINNDATHTILTDVTLNNDIIGAVDMQFQNNGGDWSVWEPYANEKIDWSLTSGDGIKTVNAHYKNECGNIISRLDTIILDTIPPTGTFSINGGDGMTMSLYVTLNNDVSDAILMRFQNSGGTWSSWYTYASTRSWTLTSSGSSTKTVNAEFKNVAGNVLFTSDYITYWTM